ncbi:MAG TPA: dihydrolipoamide acetyltransferase family protein, partial [Polyangiaceae bacterium]|nr:dihydrolipoamide acetyltransferase family protein [Polyangiaceae bacterium]
MARWEFKLPDIGEGVTEGEIVNWLISPGETVKEDQPMVEVMTDKATVTIAVPRAGTVLELRGKVGDIVAVHATLVVFDVGAPGAAHAPIAAHANGTGNGNGTHDGPAATAVGDIRETLPGMATGAPPLQPSTPPQSSPKGGGSISVETYFNEKPLATPATRKTARELGIDLKVVPPTGPQGRVTREDVHTFAQQGQTVAPATDGPRVHEAAARPLPAVSTREPVRIVPPAGPVAPGAGALEERVPFAGMRRRIASKMATSKSTAAHFTFVEECDVTALKALRARLKAAADAEGVKLSFLPFIVKAVIASLRKHPILNSALDETTNELVYRKYFHIGIAASTDAGLVVPVVKHADRRSLLDVAREI